MSSHFVTKMLDRIHKWIKYKNSTPEEKLPSWIKTYAGLYEDIIFWKRPLLSISTLAIINLLFILLSHIELKPLGYIFAIADIIAIMDATGFKLSKRRRLFSKSNMSDGQFTCNTLTQTHLWFNNKAADFIFLHQNNPTKAFLIMNLILGIIFLLGEQLNLYKLLYLMIVSMLTLPPVIPHVRRNIIKYCPHFEYNDDISDLIPELNEKSIRDLNFIEEDTPDGGAATIEMESLIPKDTEQLESIDISDDESTSTSLVSNISGAVFVKEFETSDDSSNDEFIPRVNKSKPSVKVETIMPQNQWNIESFGITTLGTSLSNMVSYVTDYKNEAKGYTKATLNEDSDEFEIIDDSEFKKNN